MLSHDNTSLLDGASDALEASQDKPERMAILAGLMEHGDDLAAVYNQHPDRYSRFEIRASALPGMGTRIREFSKTVRRMAKAMLDRNKEAARQQNNPAALVDLGFEGLMSPVGFKINLTGIWDGDERIAAQPVVITGSATDLDTGAMRWDLAWLYRGRWMRRSVERDAATDSRRLQKLAAYGFPVNSETGRNMVRYLTAFEDENESVIDQCGTTARMGWLAPRVFQLGEACIGSDHVLTAEDGLADLAAGWRVHGEWEDWRSTIAEHLDNRPEVLLGVYASAVAPLLEILDADGFVIDWSGATSRGKTSALRVAASIWGHPDKIVGSWGTASVVGPQESAAFLHSLPLILDDTKRVGDRGEIVARMLYDLPAGRERLRGQAGGGLRRVKTWRTVMLSTGEKAVVDFTEDAGARARSLCIRGAPFGADCTANRKATEALTKMTRRNHGHLGKRLITHLVETADHGSLRQVYETHRDSYAENAGGSVSRRLASSVAAIHLAAELCHDLGLPNAGQMVGAIDIAWKAALASGANSDRPAAAFLALHNWAIANRSLFMDQRNKDRASPPGGWAGRWDIKADTIAIFPRAVHETLDRQGFDRDYCLNEWARRGWLMLQGDGHRQRKVRMGDRVPRLYVFDLAETPIGVEDD